jgi:hypothetical protein
MDLLPAVARPVANAKRAPLSNRNSATLADFRRFCRNETATLLRLAPSSFFSVRVSMVAK